ncbi:MAG TPA: hypothetical protein VM166_15070, partial [Gemmatimonadaceae bacterium]|nr:hypothetical protein [Gemmatimonadaceae bacterium]
MRQRWVKIARRIHVCGHTRRVECARAGDSLERSSSVDARWAACERFVMGCGDEGGTLVGGQTTHEAQGGLLTMGASRAFGARLVALGVGGRWSPRRQHELQTTQGIALARVQQSERADAVQATQRDVLKEAPQEFVGGQRHGLAQAVTAVTIGEGDGTVFAAGDGLVGECGAVDVARQVVEHG